VVVLPQAVSGKVRDIAAKAVYNDEKLEIPVPTTADRNRVLGPRVRRAK